MTEQCPWKIRWTIGQDAQCEKQPHELNARHQCMLPNGVTVVNWFPGDRREFTGDWPGPCLRTQGCTLHTGHHGNCAP